MRQLSQGSGMTPDAFVLDWLKLWVNNQTVNGDVVAARSVMFARVINPFTHINPLVGVPAPLSGFLPGGGPGFTFNVADPQLGSPTWRYADLEQRFKRLYDIAYCVQCTRTPIFDTTLPDRIGEITGRLPIDPVGPVKTQFEIGPIHDIAQVKQLLEVRSSLVKGFEDQPVDFIRRVDTTGH